MLFKFNIKADVSPSLCNLMIVNTCSEALIDAYMLVNTCSKALIDAYMLVLPIRHFLNLSYILVINRTMC